LRGDIRYHPHLAGSISGVPSGSGQLSGRSHGMATRRAGLRHPDLAARPCRICSIAWRGRGSGGSTDSKRCRTCSALRPPQSQEPMVGVRERPSRRIVIKRGSRSLSRITVAWLLSSTLQPARGWPQPRSKGGTAAWSQTVRIRVRSDATQGKRTASGHVSSSLRVGRSTSSVRYCTRMARRWSRCSITAGQHTSARSSAG